MLKSTVRLLRSVRFNITIGALIALASAVGTLLPQLPEVPEKVSAYQAAHPIWSKLFDFFGLFDLYGSWWFMGLLGLMAIDIVLCKLWSRPPDHGLVALPPEQTGEREKERKLGEREAALRLKPLQASFASGLAPEQARRRAARLLAQRGFHVHEELAVAAGASLVATKHRFQRWGSYFAHVGLVVILAGSLVKGLFGFVEMVPVLEGASREMQHKPDWRVFVDDFDVQFYDNRVPKHFSSVMRVEREDGAVLGAKTIVVNDPLDIDGVRFYQATWGAGGMFRSVTLKIGDALLQMPQKTKKKLAGTPFTVEADMMLPNFTIEDGRAQNGSLDLKNPAVRFVFHVGPHRTKPLWLFRDDPELCFIEDSEGRLAHAPKPPFALADVDPVLFSGIQVAYDPGYKIVVAGSIAWLIGTVALFYLHRRRLWLLLEPGPGGSALRVGAWSSRGVKEYEAEFTALMARLRDGMDARSELTISKNSLVEVSS